MTRLGSEARSAGLPPGILVLDTRSAAPGDLQGAGWLIEEQIAGLHLTRDPEPALRAIRAGAPLGASRQNYSDLGTGLYLTGEPDEWAELLDFDIFDAHHVQVRARGRLADLTDFGTPDDSLIETMRSIGLAGALMRNDTGYSPGQVVLWDAASITYFGGYAL